MLRNTQAAQPTIKDTPLSMLAVTKEEIKKMAISVKVFENAEYLKKCNFEVGNPYNEFEYTVKIEWPELQPRTPRAWHKTYPSSCTCPGYLEHGPVKFCKHINLILLKYFSI